MSTHHLDKKTLYFHVQAKLAQEGKSDRWLCQYLGVSGSTVNRLKDEGASIDGDILLSLLAWLGYETIPEDLILKGPRK